MDFKKIRGVCPPHYRAENTYRILMDRAVYYLNRVKGGGSMKTKTAVKTDCKKNYAAQNAKLGLITTADLGLLTGVEVSCLNSFAKKGVLDFYGEYHGKRFFNFEEVVNWASEAQTKDEAKIFVQTNIQTLLNRPDCLYTLKNKTEGPHKSHRVRIV